MKYFSSLLLNIYLTFSNIIFKKIFFLKNFFIFIYFLILVKQLNVQWRESTNKVIDKKNQLEIMLTESRKLELINNDFLEKIPISNKRIF